jgi:hypothetical protein
VDLCSCREGLPDPNERFCGGSAPLYITFSSAGNARSCHWSKRRIPSLHSRGEKKRKGGSWRRSLTALPPYEPGVLWNNAPSRRSIFVSLPFACPLPPPHPPQNITHASAHSLARKTNRGFVAESSQSIFRCHSPPTCTFI